MSIPEGLQIRPIASMKGLFTRHAILRGTVIFNFVGDLLHFAEANFQSLQIDEDLFLESTEAFDDFLNHSCRPNGYVRFDPDGIRLVALRDIVPGEELSFHYCTTEYDCVEQGCSFVCHCGAPDCLGKIRGFRYLSPEQKRALRPWLSPFLRKKSADFSRAVG